VPPDRPERDQRRLRGQLQVRELPPQPAQSRGRVQQAVAVPANPWPRSAPPLRAYMPAQLGETRQLAGADASVLQRLPGRASVQFKEHVRQAAYYLSAEQAACAGEPADEYVHDGAGAASVRRDWWWQACV